MIAEQQNKTISVAVYDFETGKKILISADEPFHAAGTCTLHVLMEVFHPAEQGLISVDDCLPITNSFARIVDGGRFALLEDGADRGYLFCVYLMAGNC